MSIQLNPDQFEDPMWRIHNLYTIVDKSGKITPFRPNWAQVHFLENMHQRNLILKARQLGFTTLMAIVQLDDCIFTPNTSAAIIAHKIDDAKRIFRDKVKFTYNQLDWGLKSAVPPKQDSSDTLTLANDSSFQVSTSARSGTLQWLHISEYGKICAQYPEKAREIRTGSLPAAEQGVTTIESTAEGQDGDFYDKSMLAESLMVRGLKPSRLDFKFFFYPWYMEPRYSLEQVVVPMSKEDREYFNKIEAEIRSYTGDEDFKLEERQKNWWITEEVNLAGDMKREYPATPREAFEQAIEGAFFAKELSIADKTRRIGDFPIRPEYPVNTFWDLGRNDLNVIWLEQDYDGFANFIGYYEDSDYFIGHYINWLKEWALDHGITFGTHYLPHDGDVKTIWTPGSSMQIMANLGFRPKIVKRPTSKIEVIRKARPKFANCRFDQSGCKIGLKRLRQFRREFNTKLNKWSETPLHNEDSHGADGFFTYVESNHKSHVTSSSEPVGDRYDRAKKEARRLERRRRSFMSA